VAYTQGKEKGILPQGVHSLPEAKFHKILTLIHNGKLTSPRKAVAGHFKAPASDLHATVLQAAYNGEQHWIPAGPISRVSAPNILGSAPVLKGHQLAAHGIHPGGKAVSL